MKNEKNKRSYTEAYQTHEDCGYLYKIVCCYDDKYSKDICIYRGENAVYKFMEEMLEEVKYCKTVIKGELQRQNKLISSERPFKILQNETKIIKIGQAVLEIINFKD